MEPTFSNVNINVHVDKRLLFGLYLDLSLLGMLDKITDLFLNWCYLFFFLSTLWILANRGIYIAHLLPRDRTFHLLLLLSFVVCLVIRLLVYAWQAARSFACHALILSLAAQELLLEWLVLPIAVQE